MNWNDFAPTQFLTWRLAPILQWPQFCPCGGTAGPDSVFCGDDCVSDGLPDVDPSARWRPDLDREVFPDDLTLLASWPVGEQCTLRVLRRDAYPGSGLVRLDNGYRFVGRDVSLPGVCSQDALRDLAFSWAAALQVALHRDESLDPVSESDEAGGEYDGLLVLPDRSRRNGRGTARMVRTADRDR